MGKAVYALLLSSHAQYEGKFLDQTFVIGQRHSVPRNVARNAVHLSGMNTAKSPLKLCRPGRAVLQSSTHHRALGRGNGGALETA